MQCRHCTDSKYTNTHTYTQNCKCCTVDHIYIYVGERKSDRVREPANVRANQIFRQEKFHRTLLNIKIGIVLALIISQPSKENFNQIPCLCTQPPPRIVRRTRAFESFIWNHNNAINCKNYNIKQKTKKKKEMNNKRNEKKTCTINNQPLTTNNNSSGGDDGGGSDDDGNNINNDRTLRRQVREYRNELICLNVWLYAIAIFLARVKALHLCARCVCVSFLYAIVFNLFCVFVGCYRKSPFEIEGICRQNK